MRIIKNLVGMFLLNSLINASIAGMNRSGRNAESFNVVGSRDNAFSSYDSSFEETTAEEKFSDSGKMKKGKKGKN